MIRRTSNELRGFLYCAAIGLSLALGGCSSCGECDGVGIMAAIAVAAPAKAAMGVGKVFAQGPTPVIEQAAPGVISAYKTIPAPLQWPIADWMDDGTLVSWGWNADGKLHVSWFGSSDEQLGSREIASRGALSLGVHGQEILTSPREPNTQQEIITATNILDGATRAIVLPDCKIFRLGLDTARLEPDRSRLVCLSTDDRSIAAISIASGAETVRLPTRTEVPIDLSNAQSLSRPMLPPSATGLTGSGDLISGYWDGQVTWAKGTAWVGQIELQTGIELIAGIPGTDLFALIKDGPKSSKSQGRAMIVSQATGRAIFDQPIVAAWEDRLVISQDGHYAAFVTRSDISLVEIGQNVATQVATIGVGPNYWITGPAFLPNGNKMAVSGRDKIVIFALNPSVKTN